MRDPDELRRWLVARDATTKLAELVVAPPGAPPDLSILDTREHLPWAGHMNAHAMAEIYERIKAAHMTLVFVNTRAKPNMCFRLCGI